jgi:hypothetical protein
VSIEFIITILRDAEVDARKAHHLAHYINQFGANMENTEALETYARNALVSINHAERLAVALRDEAEKKEESK